MISFKPGVRVMGVTPEVVIAMVVAHEIYKKHGYDFVGTSVCDGEHSANSYHYDGDGLDCRTNFVDSPEEIAEIAQEIGSALTAEYDVVVEATHIHIEFDRRRAARMIED